MQFCQSAGGGGPEENMYFLTPPHRTFTCATNACQSAGEGVTKVHGHGKSKITKEKFKLQSNN